MELTAEQPCASVIVTVGYPADKPVIVGPVWVVLHRYVPPPVAVNVADCPAQIVGLLTVGIGNALTVTVPLAVAVQPFSVTVT